MRIEKYKNGGWAVYDTNDNLVCVTLYKVGALEVMKRLEGNTIEPTINQMDIVQKEITSLSKELKQINNRLQVLAKECCLE